MGASVARIDGVISADLNFASATLLIEYDPELDPRAAVVAMVESSGHGVEPLDERGQEVSVPARPWFERHLAEISALGSGASAACGALLDRFGAPQSVVTAAFALAIVFGGLLVWRRALVSLRARVLDMNVLMSAAVFGAAALGEWGEGATVFFLFAVGGLLESRSLERTRRSIRDLMDLAPSTARVRRAGQLVEVDADDVVIGETVSVRPGERVPLDGEVVTGTTAIDEAAITGESVPVAKAPGDRVFGGTLNTTGLIDVRVTATASDSTLARIVYLVEEAQASKAPVQRFVDRFSAVYTPSVILLALMIAVVPPLVAASFGFTTAPWAEWARRALVMLVVSCPCALVISTPVSIVSGITRAGRDGVLVKGGAFLEAAANVGVVAFDKTGTLTVGRPEVQRIEPLQATSAELLAVAVSVESHSNHPLAGAIVRAAELQGVVPRPVSDVVETPGYGVSGVVDGTRYDVTGPGPARREGRVGHDVTTVIDALEDAGMTVLVVCDASRVLGLIGVADMVRAEASEALRSLKALGVEHLVMLTGDNERVARAIAEKTGVTEVRAGLMPQGKTDAVRELAGRHGRVLMVGDGVNDAPALAAADIGVAMGAAGTDTALETADVALMRDDLRALAGFVDLGRRTMRVIAQNVTASIAVKLVFLALAALGRATLWMAVFADTGVALLVIVNGMRLLRKPRRKVFDEEGRA